MIIVHDVSLYLDHKTKMMQNQMLFDMNLSISEELKDPVDLITLCSKKLMDDTISRKTQKDLARSIDFTMRLLSCRTRDLVDYHACLLYTSPSPRDATLSRMPSSA